MTEEVLIQRRLPAWQRLAALTAKADVGFKTLTSQEMVEFVRLYRQASGDLAFLAARPTNPDVVSFLNSAVSRAYAVLYRSPQRRWLQMIRSGLVTGADTVRRRAGFIGLAAALFFAGWIAAYFLIGARPDLRPLLVPPEMEMAFEAWTSGDLEARTFSESMAMSAFYATNNPRVGVASASLGLASGGLMTIASMWQNGLVIGALSYETNQVGRLGYMLSSIYPHGVPEIGGIFITAASGFVMGWAIIRPGNRRRVDALKEAGKDAFTQAGKDAFTLLIVGLVLIFTAAPIEGFFSFSPAVPQPLKVVVGTILLAAYWTFFSRFGLNANATDGRPSA